MPLRHLWLALLLAFFAGAAHAQTFPALSGRVVDGANLLDAGMRCTLDRRPRRVPPDARIEAARSAIRAAVQAQGLRF